ncbi:MAG: HD domain-containing protein [Acholeplasmataceae bacterium]|nr:HD domain-containing protein [Acholeplasmataceae bacterium]
MLDRQQVLKDPLYGYIHIDDLVIKKLIDTNLFQRLRRIRQLSGVQMVFHGAEHSRFSHALGVYELAYRFLSVKELSASLDQRSQLLFKCSALLHDIGHGAYSHAFEDVFKVNHEHIGARMITNRYEIRDILTTIDKDFAKDVASILLKEGRFKLIESLISSQIDIDRLDYLERDAYFTGTAYGHIDLDRLMRVMHIKDGKIMYSLSGIHAIENYLISRYHMYWQVYYHPVARAHEVILEKIYLRVKDLCLNDFEFIADINPLKRLIVNPNDLDSFIQIDDFFINGLISSFTKSKDDILRTLSDDFLNRHIWKYVDDNEQNQAFINKIKSTYDPKQLKYFTAHKTVSNRAYQNDKADIGDQIDILLKDGSISTLEAESDIMNGLMLSGIKEDKKFFYRVL